MGTRRRATARAAMPTTTMTTTSPISSATSTTPPRRRASSSETRTTTRRTLRSEEGEGRAPRNRNMCRSTALAHNLSTHSVWLLFLFLYALPRRQSPYPSLRGATVLKCVTIDYYAAIREVVYNLHTIRSNKDGLFLKASPKQ